MIKRELKVNLRGFIIYLGILISIFLVVFLIYPSIVTEDNIKNIDEMMKIFPEEVLKTFNIDITSMSSAYGWLKSEGNMFILIIIGLYASLQGFNVVLKEENDKTIEYLSFLPIKRSSIMTNKIVVSVIYIVLMVILLGIFNYISLTLSCDFNHKEYILLSLTPLLIAMPLYSIGLFLSTFFHKTKKTTSLGLGIVFIFYVLSILSQLSDKVSFIKYFTVYTLADTRGVITDVKINPTYILISVLITVILVSLSYVRYEKKELM